MNSPNTPSSTDETARTADSFETRDESGGGEPRNDDFIGQLG